MPTDWDNLDNIDRALTMAREAEPGWTIRLDRRRRRSGLTGAHLPWWDQVVSGLAARGLVCVILGRHWTQYSPLVVPARAVPHLGTLEAMAHDAQRGADQPMAALTALHDLLAECGLDHLRPEILASCQYGPAPGGGARLHALDVSPRVTAYQQHQEYRGKVNRARKLSKDQRRILDLVLSPQGSVPPGVPLAALRGPGTWTPARAAHLSRSLRRLEARDLVRLVRSPGGQVTHVAPPSNG